MTTIKTVNKTLSTVNYPYGFNQKTTAYFSLEFNPKKGTRLIFQTDPKTGRLNTPKKETYITGLQYLEQDNNGIIKSHSVRITEAKNLYVLIDFLHANPEIMEELTPDQIEYYTAQIHGTLKYFIEWTEGSQNIFQELKDHLKESVKSYKNKDLNAIVTYLIENRLNLEEIKEKYKGEPVAKSYKMTVKQY